MKPFELEDYCTIGVVGYTDPKFDKEEAVLKLNYAIGVIGCDLCPDNTKPIMLISGLTMLGIPAVVYKYANAMNDGRNPPGQRIYTGGVACSLARNFEQWPCDFVKIVGDNWGDESEAFVDCCDVLIRLGGGPQSRLECAMARSRNIPVIEYELSPMQ